MQKNREINLIKLIFLILICIQALLSFFPCLQETRRAILGEFDSYSETGIVEDNAKWLMLTLSIIEIGMLLPKRKITMHICTAISGMAALLTSVWPVHFSFNRSYFGSEAWYKWTIVGCFVLVIVWVVFIGMIVYCKRLDKKDYLH